MKPQDLAIAYAAQHQELALQAVTDDERNAHLATMKALDKAAMEFAKGALPAQVGAMWLVQSRTNGQAVYRVDLAAQTCTCEAGMAHKPCWHLAAADVMQDITDAGTGEDVPDPVSYRSLASAEPLTDAEVDAFLASLRS